MSKAVCDPEAFYPFRSLVQGGISEAGELRAIERFLRAIVLHDEMTMVIEPMPQGPEQEEHEWTEEELAQGGRNVIVGYGPVLDDYAGLLSDEARDHREPVEPSQRLVDLAQEFSAAGPGDAFYRAHLGYLHHLAGVLSRGGSVVCEGVVGKAAFEEQEALPDSLFAALDKDWSEYIRSAQEGLGFALPPVLAIVLSRAARRSDVLRIVRDLRDEWADARRKVWELVARLRNPERLKDAYDTRRELLEAAKLFSPTQAEPSFAPIRNLSDIFAVGAATAAVSGNLEAAATAAVVTMIKKGVEKTFRELPEAGRYWFRAGAFDLARRVRTELLDLEPTRQLLERHLSAAEKESLGF